MKTCLYLRISTNEEKQDLGRQEAVLREFARRKGWEIARVYSDAESGAESRRNGLSALLRELPNPKRGWGHVLAEDLSRLTRESPRQTLAYLEKFKSQGVGFTFAREEFLSTEHPFSEGIIALISCLNQLYINTLREKTKSGLKRAKERGTVLGRPKTARRVRDQVTELLGRGFSQKEIASQLNVSISTIQRIKREQFIMPNVTFKS